MIPLPSDIRKQRRIKQQARIAGHRYRPFVWRRLIPNCALMKLAYRPHFACLSLKRSPRKNVYGMSVISDSHRRALNSKSKLKWLTSCGILPIPDSTQSGHLNPSHVKTPNQRVYPSTTGRYKRHAKKMRETHKQPPNQHSGEPINDSIWNACGGNV